MSRKLHRHALGLLLSLVWLAGCGGGQAHDDEHLLAQRTKYLFADEPTGAIPVTEARQALENQSRIVLVGRIHAGQHSPWDEGKAAFFISDAAAQLAGEDHDHGPDHDPENCPFCKKAGSLVDSLAIVKFVDQRGEVLPVDARKLLGVQENQLVVVRGKGEVDQLGNLVVAAEGIYVRR